MNEKQARKVAGDLRANGAVAIATEARTYLNNAAYPSGYWVVVANGTVIRTIEELRS